MTYVVAADGGNSKTDLVLASARGEVLARVTGTGTRPHRHGMTSTAESLAALARSAMDEAGLGRAIPAVGSFFLANVDLPEEEDAMHTALSALGVASRVEVRNDTFAVLRAGSTRGWGVAVVAGAGINAVGLHPDGREERFLAIGELAGDWGGGWAVAVAGLGAAVRAGDGRGPSTVLRELVAETFGLAAEPASVAAHRGEITERQLFDFAPVVFRAATDGDAVAVSIVERLADEVVSFAGALLQRMELCDSDVEVVLGGGTLQSGHPLLLRRIDQQLRSVAPAVQLRMLDVPPVAGALVSALTVAGADPAVIEQARTAVH